MSVLKRFGILVAACAIVGGAAELLNIHEASQVLCRPPRLWSAAR